MIVSFARQIVNPTLSSQGVSFMHELDQHPVFIVEPAYTQSENEFKVVTKGLQYVRKVPREH